MNSFTHLWTNRCRLNMMEFDFHGEPLQRSVGNTFSKAKIAPGDHVYTLCIYQGSVYLIGRMTVARVWRRQEYDLHVEDHGLWEGTEVIEGTDGTPMRFDRTLPSALLGSLRFTNAKRKIWALDVDGYRLLKRQALRNVKRLTPASASTLDAFLAATAVSEKAELWRDEMWSDEETIEQSMLSVQSA